MENPLGSLVFEGASADRELDGSKERKMEGGEMRCIDLPKGLRGSNCVICKAFGENVRARLQDREGGPVCYVHFAQLLNFEARLRAERRNRES